MLLILAALTFFRIRAIPNLLFTLLSVLFLLGLASVSQAAYADWALLELCIYFGMLLLVLLLAEAGQDVRVIKFLLLMVTICASITAWMFFVYYGVVLTGGVGTLDPYLLLYGFDNPRFLGQVQVLFFPILMALIFEYKHKGSRWWYAFLLILVAHWCIAFSMAGRGMLAAIFLSHFFVFIVVKKYRCFVSWQVATAGLGLLVFLLLFLVVPAWLNLDSALHTPVRAGLSSREVIWGVAWDMAIKNPWLGVGPLHYSAFWNHIAAHPHQAILQWFAEWGLPATIIVLALAVWGCVHGLIFLRSDKSNFLDLALWLGIVSALLLSQVDGVFVMPYTEGWFSIVIGLAWARWGAVYEVRRKQRYLFKVLSLLVIMVLSHTLMFSAAELPAAQKAFYDDNEIGSPPRLWGQGWIPM